MKRKDHEPFVCSLCGNRTIRLDFVDTHACKVCDRWCEETCEATDCHFCNERKRYVRPSLIPSYEWINECNT